MVAQFDWVGMAIAIPVGKVTEVGSDSIVVVDIVGTGLVLDRWILRLRLKLRLGVEAVVFVTVVVLVTTVSGDVCGSPTREAERAQGWEIQGKKDEEQGEGR